MATVPTPAGSAIEEQEREEEERGVRKGEKDREKIEKSNTWNPPVAASVKPVLAALTKGGKGPKAKFVVSPFSAVARDRVVLCHVAAGGGLLASRSEGKGQLIPAYLMVLQLIQFSLFVTALFKARDMWAIPAQEGTWLPIDPFSQDSSSQDMSISTPSLKPAKGRRKKQIIEITDKGRRRSARINKLTPSMGIGRPRGKAITKSSKKLKRVAEKSGILLSLNSLPRDSIESNANGDDTDAKPMDCSIQLLQQIRTEVCGLSEEEVAAEKLTVQSSTGRDAARST
uniref:Uncharacterized protein n=1 Tax=Oryza brachyantha TaxID=4533 RepID=J3NCJ7_ORYBR